MAPPAMARERAAAEMETTAETTAAAAAHASGVGGFGMAVPAPHAYSMMAAFGPKVHELRRQAAMTRGHATTERAPPMLMFPPVPFNPMTMTMVPPPTVMMPQETAVKVNARHSPSGSDGSHHTTHGADESVERGQEAACSSGRGQASMIAMMMPPPPLVLPLSLKNARLEALQVPDRTQTPGIRSPFSAANVLVGMMANGSDKENERSMGQPSRVRGKRGEYLGPLSVKCPKKRRTTKNSRARSNLKTFDALPAEAPNAAARPPLKSTASNKPKTHRPWSLPEVKALIRGVTHYGRGQWADIKALRRDGVADDLINRSAVDLKDKWRNLLRVAMLPGLYKRRDVNGVPSELLEQVRVLASKSITAPPRRSKDNGAHDQAENAADADVKTEKGLATSKGARRSKHHSPWTMEEAMALVDGVDRCGGCRWTIIKKCDDPVLERRTAMDLKDKWRNLLQLASLPAQSRRKQETPPEFLQRVLDLEAQYGGARRKGRKTNSKA